MTSVKRHCQGNAQRSWHHSAERERESGRKVLVSKKTRTIKSPENKIVPRASKKKGTIYLKTEASGILIDEESYSHEQNTARIADSLYIISRKIHPKTSSICQDRRGLILKSTKELGLLQLLATYR